MPQMLGQDTIWVMSCSMHIHCGPENWTHFIVWTNHVKTK